MLWYDHINGYVEERLKWKYENIKYQIVKKRQILFTTSFFEERVYRVLLRTCQRTFRKFDL